MKKLSCGIVGLPNVGKSTLFNSLTKNEATASNYPFCTIDPNIGVVDVKDPRLNALSDMSKSQKVIPAAVTFVDIAGLVKGASQGEGLGNKFLANIRETSIILHVVRCFDDENVIHVEGKIDPIQDIEVINLELILADLQMTENITQKLAKQAKGNKDLLPTLDTLKKVLEHLNNNNPVRSLDLTKEEWEQMSQYHFLTSKTVIYVANVSENGFSSNPYLDQVTDYATKENNLVITICAKLEAELVSLSDEESLEYLHDMGLKETGLDRLIKASFTTLGLITYITSGEMETRAWPIVQGTNAQLAAGEIHTDIQKGFIRAEVVTYDDIMHYGGRNAAKEAGKTRSEGKEYIMQDGDVVLFYHN